VTDVPPVRLRRFFTKEPGGYRVQKHIREMVMFAPHNLIKDPPFSRVDLVSCRNLLIYLNREIQGGVLDIIHFALRPDGFMMLGTSESIDETHDMFAIVDKPNRLYRAQMRSRTKPLAAMLPAGITHAVPATAASRCGVTMPTARFTRACSRAMRRHRSSSTITMRSSTCPRALASFSGSRPASRRSASSTPCIRRCASRFARRFIRRSRR
jgi:two-component system CheB/CheR fusion protein